MQDLEPFYHWRDIYKAEEDENSPFYQREYSEMYYSNTVYNHVIHPQWDEFGSQTLYTKILYADYDGGYAIMELIGEWNDCIDNDIMFLKRDVVEPLMEAGVNKFILIGENVLNIHPDTDDYYAEWFEELEDGWISAINFRPHVLEQLVDFNLDYYFVFGGKLDEFPWRTMNPKQLYAKVEEQVRRRLG